MQNQLKNHLKILVVLPFYGGSLPIGRYCVAAFQNLGHTVEVFESPDFNASYNGINKIQLGLAEKQYFEQQYVNLVSRMVYAKVEASKPDLVFALAQAPMSISILKRLRQDKIATAMWFVEDFRLFTYWRAFAPYYDFFAVIQKEPFLSELEKIGVENALYLPLAALPSVHAKLKLNTEEQNEYGSDLSFLGAGYPNRRVAFKRLLPFNFKIWGTEWGDDVFLKPLIQKNGARISSEEAVKIYNATKINLNLHSSVQTQQLVSGGDFVNPRTFELAACSAFQLVDKRSLMSELFAEDELATFNNMDELVEKIKYFLDNPVERNAYIERSLKRVLADHTYEQRLNSFIDFVLERNQTLKAKMEQTPVSILDQLAELGGDKLSKELQAEVLDICEKLALPLDVSFEDLILKIRAQAGKLNSVESALLFLDEWKKQYQSR
ncbi:CgeB family protein [Desulfovibrio litoralis]|uniref:Spore maturation protein CgeB n=1 Tax=Desulfovibrio litoralis DSM 11393 TaxID=1121455 RepID=A0A1M7THT6_9BACT|nr:glycosyltransferase [Desulfovibrio litoralis]SHN70168.1 spore maturation protein CgeB [Desulfovibrio litoralis DSM 11393]